MTLQEFFDKWGGKVCDYDGIYGAQCVDLVDRYLVDVLGAPVPWVVGAKDFWNKNLDWCTKIANTPAGFPRRGDIIVWSNFGNYGHIAICVTADVNTITSLDQNWPYGLAYNTNPSKVCQHNYNYVLGWFRPNMALDLPWGWNSEDYLTANPDVRNAKVDPIWHYMHYGFKEGRLLHPLPPPPPAPVVPEPVILVPVTPEPPVIPETPVEIPIPEVDPVIQDEPKPEPPSPAKLSFIQSIINLINQILNWLGRKL